MDLEELTLHYYIKIFSSLLVLIFILFFLYSYLLLNQKNISFFNSQFIIGKGESFNQVFNNNIKDLSFIDIYITKIYYRTNNILFNEFMHYGEFDTKNVSSLIDFLKLITEPSNVLNKITIVEGWSLNDLRNELLKYFIDPDDIPYENIIADTYFFEKNKNFNSLKKKIYINKNQYFSKYKQNDLLKKYSEKEIIIIASLIEKEGFDIEDKKIISSVIFNRLNINMKLQIDATVLYAVTKGNYNLNRKLTFSDLKIEHPFNTYHIYGLPPQPISYVGKKTLDIIFENYKSEFLFYFYNNSLNRHIFSKTYVEHKKKLNEYRNKK